MSMTWGGLSDKLVTFAKSRGIPVSGTFELTSRCNLQCKMCYLSQPSNDTNAIAHERSADEWIRLAQEARDAGMLYLLLTGGEVFLRKDIKTIYKEISMMGFSTQIYTNATMITPETAKWIGQIPPSKISITLYGASPETYAKVCGDAGAFERTVRGIDLLLAEGITLEVKTTVVQDNADDFDKITEFVEERDVEFGIVNYISPRREGCRTDPGSHRLSPADLIKYEMRVEEYNRKKRSESLSKRKGKDISTAKIDDDNTPDKNSLTQNTNDPFRCIAGKCAFWVSWDGRMLPCGLMNNPGIFPFENGFVRSWEQLKALCASIPVCTACTDCSYKSYCMTCPARLMIETGHYDKPAPYLCETARLRSEFMSLKDKESSLELTS